MRTCRIALTGASSTGKTTLAEDLARDLEFTQVVPTYVPEGARELLASMGRGSFDELSREELRDFQRQFFARKRRAEPEQGSYLVDRSFVDVAAVWLERDTFDQPEAMQNELLVPCRSLASRYTLHIWVPPPVAAFEHDGVREADLALHGRIARRITRLLEDWALPRATLASLTREQRVDEVKGLIARLQLDP